MAKRPTAYVVLMICCAFTLAPGLTEAQGQVRAWGMGGALTASARGLAAVNYNPANLALSSGSSLGLPSAAVMVGNNSLSLDRYNEITGSYLNSTDKDRLMADIPAGGFNLDADIRMTAVGYHSGPFAFSIGARGQGRGNLDRDYFDLALYGNEVGQTVDFRNTWGGGYAVGRATVSWATPVYRSGRSLLAAGMNLHYLQGIYEIHIDRAGGVLNTALTGVDGTAYVDAVSSDGGAGYGVDLGLTWERGAWNVALAIDNASTHLAWNSGLQEDSYAVTATAVTMLNGDLDTAVVDEHASHTAKPYQTHLPRTYRVGVGHQGKKLLTNLDLTREGSFTVNQPQRNRLAMGAEYRLTGWFSPRVGLRMDEGIGTGAALGMGISTGPMRIDAAAMTIGGLAPGQAKGFGIAVGTHLVF